MAVKTITIDMEAYELLSAARQGTESFSTVIKHTLAPASRTASGLLRYLSGWQPDDALVSALETVYAEREGDLIAAESAQPYSSERS